MTNATKISSLRQRYIQIVILFIFLNTWVTTQSRAADLSACVFSLQPFGGSDKEGNPIGIIPEIIEELREETGLAIQINVVSYKRMFNELAIGKCDFAIFFRTEKSNEIAIPKSKIYTLKNVVVGLKGLNLDGYDDLRSRTVTLPRGTFYQKKFDNDLGFQKILVPGFNNAVKMLIYKRTELIAGPEISIIHHLKKFNLTPAVLGKPYVLNYSSAWLQVSAKSKNLTTEKLSRLTGAIKKLRQGDVINEIIQNYY